MGSIAFGVREGRRVGRSLIRLLQKLLSMRVKNCIVFRSHLVPGSVSLHILTFAFAKCTPVG